MCYTYVCICSCISAVVTLEFPCMESKMFDIHIGIKGELKMTWFILLECFHLSISWTLHLTARSSRNSYDSK